MNGYNVFNAIHEGLRRMIRDIRGQAAKKHYSNSRIAMTLTRLEKVLWYFDQFGDYEDAYVFAVIRQYAADLLDALENDGDAGIGY